MSVKGSSYDSTDGLTSVGSGKSWKMHVNNLMRSSRTQGEKKWDYAKIC